MKKIFLFFIITLLVSCRKDDEMIISNELQKRVVIYGTSEFADSTVQYCENKLIMREDFFYKSFSPTANTYTTFEYNEQNLLIKKNYHRDSLLKEQFGSSTYYYNSDNSIDKVVYHKYKPSNLSANLFHNTTSYEYIGNTVKRYFIDHLQNDRKKLEYKGIIKKDSIIIESTLYLFDNDSDLYQVNFLGDPSDALFGYETTYKYLGKREPLLLNCTGTLNSVFLQDPMEQYAFELSSKYFDEFFAKSTRSGNFQKFSYTFDKNNRVIEAKSTSSYNGGDVTIKYYYE